MDNHLQKKQEMVHVNAMRALHIIVLFCLLFVSQVAFSASLQVPAGAIWYVNGSTLAANTYDLDVHGTLVITSGNISVLDVTIHPGGVINAGGGLIQVSGNWTNNGTFNAGTSRVEFIDGDSPTANIFGSTTFYDLAFISSNGKIYRFSPDDLIAVLHNLLIQGVQGTPIILESSQSGRIVSINVGGSSSVNYADMQDVTIQQGGAIPIPTLQSWAIFLLTLLLILSPYFYRQRLADFK